jgi:hypothetical protein
MPPNKLLGGAKGAKDKLPAAVDNLPGISKVRCTLLPVAAAATAATAAGNLAGHHEAVDSQAAAITAGACVLFTCMRVRRCAS